MGARASVERVEDIPSSKPIEEVNYMQEQRAIIDSDEPSIKVIARAGTGKTTTLVGYACARPKKRMLYLAFNKAIQAEASGKFPSNVTCQTTHAVAYRATEAGRRFNSNGRTISAGLKPFDLSTPFGAPYTDAASAIKILNHFIVSADDAISEMHAINVGINPSLRDRAVELAREAWRSMISASPRVPMIHDGYLKLFQLSGSPIGVFDTVLFDEIQDANPVTTAIVNGTKAGKVFVGDKHQSIYAFRGAKNAMDQMTSIKEYPLNSSFRFGQELADAANVVLKHTLGETGELLVGLGAKSFIGDESHALGYKATIAKITRTNGLIFEMASECIRDGTPFHIIGGPESLKISLVMDVFKLYDGRRSEIGNPQIKQFASFDEFIRLSEESEDVEYKSIGKAIKSMGSKTPAIIDALRHQCLPSTSGASMIFSTAHKSKGLEFDSVQLMDDFVSLTEKSQEDDGVDIQEGNLIYVAMTRAKRNLFLNADLKSFVKSPSTNIRLFEDPSKAGNVASNSVSEFSKAGNNVRGGIGPSKTPGLQPFNPGRC